MSILSDVTGIGINPFGKRKFKIDPLKALGTVATVGSFGGLGPVAGALSHIPGGAAMVKGATKVGGVLSAGKRLLGGGNSGVPEVTRGGVPISLSDINPNIPADPSGADGGGGGIMDFLKGHAGDIGVGALGVFDAANAARASKRQGNLSDEALRLSKDRWNSGAGLREAGTAGLMAPVDFNQVYSDPTNPFAQQPQAPRRRLMAGGRV